MQIIKLTAEKQNLTVDGAFEYASNTVDYIRADFTLDEVWKGFDSVRAIWQNGKIIPTILKDDSCFIPSEVLSARGVVKVNLVGSNLENGELVDRITSFPVAAVVVTKDALIDDGEKLTPTEFEQFVAIVKADADRAEHASEGMEEYAERAEDAADRAEEAADSAIKVGNMTVSAETLSPGSEATVTKTDDPETKGFHLEFGIPAGVKGDKGDIGETGNGIARTALNPDYTLTITFTDGTSVTTGSIRGEQGIQGIQGIKGETGNGIANAVLNADYTLTLTFTDGTSYTTPPIRGAQGEQGIQGAQGPQGDDYILTAQDKSDIADIVVSLIGSADTTSY